MPKLSPSPSTDPTPYIKTMLGDLLLQIAILQAQRDQLLAELAKLKGV